MGAGGPTDLVTREPGTVAGVAADGDGRSNTELVVG
jgi:hypothetical protein